MVSLDRKAQAEEEVAPLRQHAHNAVGLLVDGRPALFGGVEGVAVDSDKAVTLEERSTDAPVRGVSPQLDHQLVGGGGVEQVESEVVGRVRLDLLKRTGKLVVERAHESCVVRAQVLHNPLDHAEERLELAHVARGRAVDDGVDAVLVGLEEAAGGDEEVNALAQQVQFGRPDGDVVALQRCHHALHVGPVLVDSRTVDEHVVHVDHAAAADVAQDALQVARPCGGGVDKTERHPFVAVVAAVRSVERGVLPRSRVDAK